MLPVLCSLFLRTSSSLLDGFFYSENRAQWACLDCDAGTFSKQSESICEQCSAGKFSTSIGAVECQMCVSGKYSLQGATVCVCCTAGTFSLEGVSTCEPCIAGKFSVSDEAKECQNCVSGKYSSEVSVLLVHFLSIGHLFVKNVLLENFRL